MTGMFKQPSLVPQQQLESRQNIRRPGLNEMSNASSISDLSDVNLEGARASTPIEPPFEGRRDVTGSD